MEVWQIVVLAAHGLLLAALSAFALHRLRLAWWARRLTAGPGGASTAELPTVVVQLPLYNERCVAERVIAAACALRYPRERLSIQVLDDSTDETRAIVDAAVSTWRAVGAPIEVLRRTDRAGFKAGALAAGLAATDAELVAIFDADFVPEPDFLERLVPSFADPEVGMAQACWGHLNRRASALTRAEAVLLDGHFHNEHAGRCAAGLFFNFNGTAGVWRRRTIVEAGGWLARTITEDLDLSYRAQLRGWRFVYRGDVVVPAELPEDVCAFETQQRRWAVGGAQTARLLLPSVWRAPGLGWRRRVEATLHLLGNVAYPLVLLFLLLAPVGVLARPASAPTAVRIGEAALAVAALGSWCAFYGAALKRATGRWRSLVDLPAALALGVGLAVNNTVGMVEGMGAAGRSSACPAFVRTPKRGEGSPSPRYEAPPPGGRVQGWLETALGMYAAWAAGFAAAAGSFGALLFLGLFAWGFLVLGVSTLQRTGPREAFTVGTSDGLGDEMVRAQ